MKGRGWKIAATCTLALATLVGAGAALAALYGGGSFALAGRPVFELAAGYDRAANARMTQPGPRARADAAELSRRALSQTPYDVAAYLRLASLDVLANGRLTPTGVAALARSYDLVAIDPYAASWRVGFALDHWPSLTPDLKRSVRAEAFALGGEWRHQLKIIRVLRGTHEPSARLTAALWAARIENTPAH